MSVKKNSYKVFASYFGQDEMQAARDYNQQILDIWGTNDGGVQVEFVYFREFEKTKFLEAIGANKSNKYIETYLIGSDYD